MKVKLERMDMDVSNRYRLVIMAYGFAPVGVILFMASGTSLFMQHDFQKAVSLAIAAAFLVGLCAHRLPGMGWIFLRQLRQVTRMCRNIRLGDYSFIGLPNQPGEGEDESEMIGLMRNMNWMAHQIRTRESDLERRVEERTRALSAANRKLRHAKEMVEGHLLSANDSALRQETYFRELFMNSPQAIMLLGTDGEVMEVNGAFEKTFGHPEDEIRGHKARETLVPEGLLPEHDSLWTKILAGRTISLETERRSSGGRPIPVSLICYPVRQNGKTEAVFSIYEDISERRQFEGKLRHQAFHDTLTGIPNRLMLMQRLEKAIADRKQHPGESAALLLIDLDRFKGVNDSLGHPAGDALLISVSRRIRACLRAGDTLARLGGDEFAVLIRGGGCQATVNGIAERIREAAEAPFLVEGSSVHIGASIGIVMEALSYDSGRELLRDADIAMYQAKKMGRGRHVVFTRKMREEAVDSLDMENRLRDAIEEERLALHYQPIVSVSSGRMEGFEALLRWPLKSGGMIPPDRFIPIAEESGLIIPLGKWVVEEACRQLAEWRNRGDASALTMNINISVKQFLQHDFVDLIAAALVRHGVPPECLKLELTETVLMTHTKSAGEKLARLRELGVVLVIDDFGTGYSSLSYIQRFDVDTLKIDRSFIRSMEASDESVEIVKTIIALSRALGLTVVAEGVEERSQLAALSALDCENAQGYLFSKPVDPAAAGRLIEDPTRFSREFFGGAEGAETEEFEGLRRLA